MTEAKVKETRGAWLVHHGQKLAQDVLGASEFPAIDEAAKAATLIARLGASQESVLSAEVVRAIAQGARLNPRHELEGLLKVLQRRRLIDRSSDDSEIAVLGVTTRAALQHAADIFDDADPTAIEEASISLAEEVSRHPTPRTELEEAISDKFELSNSDTREFISRAEALEFVDAAGSGADRLLFNGNLFRRDNVQKCARVVDSLSIADKQHLAEVQDLLSKRGCVELAEVERIVGKILLEKLIAAGFYDLNIVGNDAGDHVFVTSPSAFHKYVDPMIDDCFDMAKSLVAALTYGMTKRSPSTGKIAFLGRLLARLVDGNEIGSATAIGQDYRVLEINRVVALRKDPSNPSRYFMRLLKREVGELALHVLQFGSAASEALSLLPEAPMKTYAGPEVARRKTRRSQSPPSKKGTRDVLEVLRSGVRR